MSLPESFAIHALYGGYKNPLMGTLSFPTRSGFSLPMTIDLYQCHENYVQYAMMELISTDHDTVRVLFPEHAKLAALLRVIPISISSVERSFSTMGRIQSSVSNRFTHTNLDALMRISIEGKGKPTFQFLDKLMNKWLGIY